MPVSDRVGLVGDAFALAAAGAAPTPSALQLLRSLGEAGEKEYCVWAAAAAGLTQLSSAFYESPAAGALRTFTRGLFAPLAATVGWEAGPSEGHLSSLLRTLALAKAGDAADPAVLADARARFVRFTEGGDHSAIPAGLRPVAFRAIVAAGGLTVLCGFAVLAFAAFRRRART